MKDNARKTLSQTGIYLALCLFLVFALFPFFWVAITSVKTDAEIYSLRSFPLWIAKGITATHFRFLFAQTEFLTWFKNSIVVSILVSLISSALSVLAAYSIARLRFRGSDTSAMMIFVSYLVPPTLLFLPLAFIIGKLSLLDSISSLLLSYPTFAIPFCTWLLMSYFKTIPQSLEEAAIIDGASLWQALFKIILPVAAPGVVTAFLFTFSLSWSQFIYPLSFISSSSKKVVSTGVPIDLVYGDIYYWGPLMAAALIGCLPIILLCLLLGKYFISGLTIGSSKY